MNKISVAIPTYFSSNYITPLINSIKKHTVVNEIVISDDSEDKAEFKKIDTILKNLLQTSNLKLKVIQNNSNKGGFKNKYHCISMAENKYVYQIDSDNIANSKFLHYLQDKDFNEFDINTLYIPSKIYLFKKNKYERYLKRSNNVIYLKEDFLLSPQFLKETLLSDKQFVMRRNINWLLKTGNPFFYKETYLNNLEEGLKMPEKKLSAADAIAMIYYWLFSKNDVCISKFLSHYHRTHADSYWIREGTNSVTSVDYFRDKIKGL